ncbi:hypothetical protein [Streptomyces sp. NPDC004266]|uniref:hypothetical protein n=1 Tax=Streptomyces sp. NPDC004266 TaxID=3364693 RepID=UPI00369AFF28
MVEAPFRDLVVLGDRAVEGRRPTSAAAAPGADRVRAGALVAQDVIGSDAGAPGSDAGHRIASLTVVNRVQSLVLPRVGAVHGVFTGLCSVPPPGPLEVRGGIT